MPMPKTAMNEYNHLVSRQYDIGRAGQITDMQSVTEPHSMDYLAYDYFRLGVAARNSRHNPASFFLAEDVRHSFNPLDIIKA